MVTSLDRGFSASLRMRIRYCVIFVSRCLFLCTRNLGQNARCSSICGSASRTELRVSEDLLMDHLLLSALRCVNEAEFIRNFMGGVPVNASKLGIVICVCCVLAKQDDTTPRRWVC